MESIGLNHIRFDGFNYFINYLVHQSEDNYAYKFTLNRIQRKFRRLSEYLGGKPSELHSRALEIIASLKQSTYLLDSLNISSFKYDGNNGVAIMELEIRLTEIIDSVLTLRVVINKS